MTAQLVWQLNCWQAFSQASHMILNA